MSKVVREMRFVFLPAFFYLIYNPTHVYYLLLSLTFLLRKNPIVPIFVSQFKLFILSSSFNVQFP